MRLTPKPGGTKQQFRAMLFTQPFDHSWGVTAVPTDLIRLTSQSWTAPKITGETWSIPRITGETWAG